MKKLVLFILLLAVGQAYAADSETAEYLRSCKKMLLESKPKMDRKDVDMLCRDPYLKGKPNESKEDLARRQRLLGETIQDTEKLIDKLTSPKKAADSDPMSQAKYLKECKKMLMEQDPGREPKDADMLCSDPYLKGKIGESYDDQVRRKRLIRETERAKEKTLEKSVTPSTSSYGEGIR